MKRFRIIDIYERTVTHEVEAETVDEAEEKSARGEGRLIYENEDLYGHHVKEVK